MLFMGKVSKKGGKTLYINLSVYRNAADPEKNLTISCPDADTRFRTTLSDNGLKRFRELILKYYKEQILDSDTV
jgi:hypothetical protein